MQIKHNAKFDAITVPRVSSSSSDSISTYALLSEDSWHVLGMTPTTYSWGIDLSSLGVIFILTLA